MSSEIEKASSRQFVVATIPDLQGYPIEEYGYKLGRTWGIGQKDANNGIILIVAPNDRKVRIEVGRGLEPIMTDAMSSIIINETILPKFKSGDVAGGIIAGANAIGEQMKLPLEAAEQRSTQIIQAHNQQGRQRENSSGGGLPFFAIVVLFIIVFFMLAMFRRRGGGVHYSGGSGIGSTIANVALWSTLDSLSNRDRGNSGWGGGSSWGGGDGGGGGGFSGGGGDFGGGGASGDW